MSSSQHIKEHGVVDTRLHKIMGCNDLNLRLNDRSPHLCCVFDPKKTPKTMAPRLEYHGVGVVVSASSTHQSIYGASILTPFQASILKIAQQSIKKSKMSPEEAN